ncbi:uncharacterized protein TNIN_465271, partial [Trichonephila inaurata madagascariensis]
MYTLEEICLVNVATRIYNCFELKKNVLHCEEKTKELRIREGLQIPLALKDRIVALMKPIELEVHNWMSDHDGILKTSGEESFCEFHWNPDATVDRIRTADALIGSQRLDNPTRFVLSCQYWHGRKIIPVYRKLDAETKEYFLERDFDGKDEHQSNVEKWIREQKGTKPNCNVFCRCRTFRWTDVSLHSRFLDCLPDFNREYVLCTKFKETHKMHIGRFCLSRMSAQNREYMLAAFPLKVLSIYLFWPCQTFFMEAARKVWRDLSENEFLCLLHIMICQKIIALWTDFNYMKLLRQFWHESPDNLKQYTK